MVRTKDTQIIGGTRVVARKAKSPRKKIVAPPVVVATNKRRFRPGNYLTYCIINEINWLIGLLVTADDVNSDDE